MGKKSCLLGVHSYENIDELQVYDAPITTSDKTANVVGINYVCRCTNCGKIKSVFVATNSNYLDDGRGVITNK